MSREGRVGREKIRSGGLIIILSSQNQASWPEGAEGCGEENGEGARSRAEHLGLGPHEQDCACIPLQHDTSCFPNPNVW